MSDDPMPGPDTDSGADAVGSGAPEARRSTRGQLVVAVLACTVGAGLALYASSKNWAVELTQRPAPLPPVRTARSGGDFVPWVPALALISLAGAGALVATRRKGRLLVGVLLALAGGGVVAGAAYGLAEASGATGSTGPGWPLAALFAGLVIVAVGILTLRRGRGWPTMGARYERTTSTAPVSAQDDSAKVWDALDRGDDPTIR